MVFLSKCSKLDWELLRGMTMTNFKISFSDLLGFMDVSNEDMDMVCKWINLP